jgi:alcohol dehydrogenase class IV
MPRFLRFGSGAVDDLAEHLALVEPGEVCLITDVGVRAAGLTEPVERLVRRAGLALDVYDQVEAQPSLPNIQVAVDRVRSRGSVAVVAVGGGSAVDVAKIAALLARNEGSSADIVKWFGGGFGKERAMQPPLPLFTVPTMVSGADVISAAAVTDPDAQTKFACWSSWLMPQATFLDPANTASAPRDVLVDAALDAFSHALEGLTSRKTTPIAQTLALNAGAHIFRALPTVDSTPDDAAAREELCLGCLEAALVIGHTRGAAIHGLSYPVSSAFPISHGRSNAVLAPTVVRFNGLAVTKEYGDLARALDLDAGDDPVEALAEGISRLNRSLGLPANLAKIGVTRESIPDLVERAERNRWFFDDVNPRPVSRADLEYLYGQALAQP